MDQIKAITIGDTIWSYPNKTMMAIFNDEHLSPQEKHDLIEAYVNLTIKREI